MHDNFSAVTSRTGPEPFEFRRVNVLLGANGTGKSRFIVEIRDAVQKSNPVPSILNIEGGRAITLQNSLALNSRNFEQFKNTEATIGHHKAMMKGSLQNRVFAALKSLEQMSESQKVQHSDAVAAWSERRKNGEVDTPMDPPLRKADPMATVFQAFSDIFPTIKLQYLKENQSLVCKKSGNQYGPTQLSDGEKQVFSILVDIIELAEKTSFLFIDEPELNLNPALANRVWNSIEEILPNAKFVYATHSVSFALRENVELLLVLSNDNANIQEISDISDLPRRDREELLGNIPGLIENKVSLVVEGEDESFDSIFYDWILEDRDVTPKAVGGCEDVKAIVLREGKWRKITPNVKLIGIVDRDYKPGFQLESLSDIGLVALKAHEAESYLCSPELLAKLADALHTVPSLPSEETLTQLVIDFCKRERLKTVARRVSERLRHRIGVSVPSKTLGKISSEEQLKKAIVHDARRQKSLVAMEFDDAKINSVVDEELRVVDRAIESRSVEKLLTLFPGKELLYELSRAVGCISGMSLARAARHHLKLDDFPALLELRKKLRQTIKDASTEVEADVVAQT